MKEERYHNVWQRGYEAGAEDATRALVNFLRLGGQIVPAGFDGLAVKYSTSHVRQVSSLLALPVPTRVRDER